MGSMMRRPLAAILLVALASAGCSSDGDADTTAASENSSAVQAAEELVAEYTQVPSPRQVEPLASSVPEGLDVVFIGCALPACSVAYQHFEAAADSLGWNAKEIVPDFTPESVQAAFDSAIQTKPDGIEWLSTMPIDILDEQVKAAHDAGIWTVPVAAVTVTADDVGENKALQATVLGGADKTRSTEIQAAFIIEQASANGDSLKDIGFVYDPTPPAYALAYDVFKREIEAAGGSVVPIQIKFADVGTAVPGQIANELQSNPDIKYLGVVDDLMVPGVPDAIEAAGLPLPGIVGLDPQPENLDLIRDGRQLGSVMTDLSMAQWDVVDIFARLSTNDPGLNRTPTNEYMLVTGENIDQAADYVNKFPGVPDAYTAAWQAAN